MNYIVVDVETPNQWNDSICAIGVQTIDDLEVTGEWYSLVNPSARFAPFNISIHGIYPEMVESAPSFPEIWERVRELSEGRVFVAHNAPFDVNVLSKCIARYNLPPFVFTFLDTVRLGRYFCRDWPRRCGAFKLQNMSERLGVRLEHHHNAMEDTRACGSILLKLMELYHFNPEDFLSVHCTQESRVYRPERFGTEQ